MTETDVENRSATPYWKKTKSTDVIGRATAYRTVRKYLTTVKGIYCL